MPFYATKLDPRVSPPHLRAGLVRNDDGTLVLTAPHLGIYHGAPPVGSIVSPDLVIGQLDVLGVAHHIVAPPTATGRVLAPAPPRSTRGVEFAEPLLTLDPRAFVEGHLNDPAKTAQTGDSANMFRTPTAGRFYTRPAPDRPPLIAPDQIISQGQAIGLVEVMKTFSRLHFTGEGLPARVRILQVLVENEADVAAGDALFEFAAENEK